MSQKSMINIFKLKIHIFVCFVVLCLIISLFIFNKYGNISGSYPSRLAIRLKEKEVCKEILEIRRPSKQSASSNTKLQSTMEEIATFKEMNNFIHYFQYDFLSKLVPSVLKEVPASNRSSNFTIVQESRLDQMNWKIPYLPCRLREYKPDDVLTCINKREQRGQTFRITAMGDSRMRRPMEYLTLFLHKFNFTIKRTNKTDLSFEEFERDMVRDDSNVIENFIVRSSSLPTFLINFVWAPFLIQKDAEDYALQFRVEPNRQNQKHKRKSGGIEEELRRFLKQPREELPDVILLDTGLWLLIIPDEDILENIERKAATMALTLHKALKELSRRTQVILLLPHPVKEFIPNIAAAKGIVWSNKNLKWYLNAQIELFPRNMIIWDSFLPIAMASNSDCMNINRNNINISSLPQILSYPAKKAYACYEESHVGFEVIRIAVQMLLNQICNADMENDTEKNVCCEG